MTMDIGHLGDMSRYVSNGKRSIDNVNGHINGVNGHASANGVNDNGSNGFSLTGSSVQVKRHKPEQHKPGNILNVSITNFTTYSYAEFSLSPNLNMIIGPNGTGKSTLVSAICIGLGGKLDLIKRQSLESMIKSGEKSSVVDITIMGNDGKPIKITREFDASSSVWKLDDKKSTEKAVTSKVKDLNIQLDNLCHFLPQERVAEFAGLTPEKLLLETQRTLNTGALFSSHQNLIQLEDDRDVAEHDLRSVRESLEKFTTEEKDLNAEVQRVVQYDEKSKELRLHKFLLPYAIAEQEKANRKRLKSIRDTAKRDLDLIGANSDVVYVEQEKNLVDIQTNSRNLTRTRADLESSDAKDEKLSEKFERSTNAMEEQKLRLDRLKVNKDHIRREIESLTNEVRELKNSPTRDTDFDSMKKLRTEFRDRMHEKQKSSNNLTSRIEELEQEIKRSERAKNESVLLLKAEENMLNSKDRLHRLKPTNFAGNSGLQNAFMLHQELRKFKDLHCYECPVVTCELKPQAKQLAGPMERIIGFNNLVAITFTSEADFNQVPVETFNNFNSSTRIVKSKAPAASIPANELKSRYGFDGYLSDCLMGPPEVLNMLNANSKLNMIPYARDLSVNQIQRILTPDADKRVPFMRFVVGNELFNISVSKYGSRQVVYSTERISFSRWFGKDLSYAHDSRRASEAKVERFKQQIKDQVAKVNKLTREKEEASREKTTAVVEYKQLKAENESINTTVTQREILETKINNKEEMIVKKNGLLHTDESGKIDQLQRKIMKENVDWMASFVEVQQAVDKAVELRATEMQQTVKQVELEGRKAQIQKIINEIETLKNYLSDKYNKAKAEYQNARESDAAQRIREQRSEYSDEEERELASLAKTYLEEGNLMPAYVATRIKSIEDQLHVMTADKTSIIRLKTVQRQIDDYQKRLPHLESAKADYDLRIEKIQKPWEKELTKLVFKISRAFKKRFKSVASDGEVQLKKMNKFKKWRLEVLVKFRQESELKVLDRQSQSGGERAVATIFFVMALQGLTKAPLRIVDEINQGMDPKNEKTAHRYLVHTACKKSDSQYFLVTPKLLTGLYYHPNMKVHCIYTGPLLDPFKPQETDFMDFTSLRK